MFWTPRQRLALSVLILVIIGYLLVLRQMHPARVGNPQPADGPRAGELADKIDPNVATVWDLSALPNVGPAMARRIVEEREQFRKDHPQEAPYKKLEDLKRVKGIGDATLENLRPYLEFPTTQPVAR